MSAVSPLPAPEPDLKEVLGNITRELSDLRFSVAALQTLPKKGRPPKTINATVALSDGSLASVPVAKLAGAKVAKPKVKYVPIIAPPGSKTSTPATPKPATAPVEVVAVTPTKSKRVANGYAVYTSELYAQLKADPDKSPLKGLTFKERAKKISELWDQAKAAASTGGQ